MKPRMLVLLLGVAVGCATGYHSSGLTGGFKETQVGERTYQVRFTGNAYASVDRAAEFLMRRCAELTLEHGARYFMVQQQSQSGSWTKQGQAMITILDENKEDALDAVLIVQQTAERANGKLSPKALATLKEVGEKPWPPSPKGK